MLVYLPIYTQAPSKGAQFKLAAPGTTNYIFSGTTTPSYFTPHEATVTVRVTVCLNTTGTLIVGMNDGTNTVTGVLNNGVALTAGNLYSFTFEARSAYTYDFKLGTDGQINLLLVSEVGGGIT
jgi:hypothetical protein